ncbi:MAG: hypothetical protein KZQ80_16195 [Candidatus Thiodiazotropha sp. (ex Monitilora ramsayi)]|nr:hypothetical protein [Candidatus Thiodiazotropha sp. (ex Monitilora ramsayi)]
MNIGSIVKSVVWIAIIGVGLYIYTSEDDVNEPEIDLVQVLDVTVDTIVKVAREIDEANADESQSDSAFLLLSQELASAYNAEIPPLDPEQIGVTTPATIGVLPLKDASLLAYTDSNNSNDYEESDKSLFLIEVDGENSRVIATSRAGAVHDQAFSGTGLLTGFLLGHMLSRQSAAGATRNVASKTRVSPTQARARARAGSGSHSRGK